MASVPQRSPSIAAIVATYLYATPSPLRRQNGENSMSTTTVNFQTLVREAKVEIPFPYVFFFGAGSAEGNGKMRDVLGGKGAGLAEMTNAGLPVPPGFTIQTEACREYMRGALSAAVTEQMDAALARLEKLQGQRLGAGDNPLLVSVRSGANSPCPA